MTKPATAKRISRLYTDNPPHAAWRAQQAQVDADIEGMSDDPAADRFVAEMDSSGIKPRQQIERLKTDFRSRQVGRTLEGA
jgi:hypothetical protein